MQRATPPYASEVILYRTRTDILSDLRFIVDGTTYPLARIQMAQVRRLWYTLPLQLLRLMAVAAAAAILINLVGLVEIEPLPDSLLMGLLGVGGLLTFAVPINQIIPTHYIRLKLDKGQARVMHSGDAGHLKMVAGKINAAATKLRQAKTTP